MKDAPFGSDGSIYMWDGITGDLVKTITTGGNIVFNVYCITVIDENTIVYGNSLGLFSTYMHVNHKNLRAFN